MKKMNHIQARKLLIGLYVVTMSLLVLSALVPIIPSEIVSKVLMIIMFVGVVMAYVHMKCPFCGGSLPFYGLFPPEHCPHCGEDITSKNLK